MVIVIGMIAAAILIYFAFFSGGQVSEPELRDEIPKDNEIGAVVSGKYIDKQSFGKYRTLFVHYVSFECDDGESRDFSVDPEIYEAIEVGERDTLIFAEERFVGFGDHGAVEDGMGAEKGGDGFTYDDYDESIDVEQELESSDLQRLSHEDRELLEKFQEREKLPTQTDTVEEEALSLGEYSAAALLQKAAIYPFLKQENEVVRMVGRTFGEAMDDLLGYEGDSRQGRSADSVVINKNEIRVAITLQENPKPLADRVIAEFGVND